MTTNILSVNNVGKAFVDYDSEWTRIGKWFGIGSTAGKNETWVLRNVSFSIAPGECVGLIGQNGAGKSTVLKIISGTCGPTEGSIEIYGRVAAILELGLGFNSELTARENCKHVAGLMGLSAAEIENVMPGVEEFAEIGEYFDQPMRTYSSGMQMRVAFSIATCVRPDILIIDEALAVGDAYFVHKCFQRIREYRELGTSLLFVSHDPGAVQALCDRALLFENGRMIMDGQPSEVIDYYNALLGEKKEAQIRRSKSETGVVTESGNGSAQISNLRLVNSQGVIVDCVTVGESVSIVADAEIHEDLEALVFGYMIRDRLGQTVFGTNTFYTDQTLNGLPANSTCQFSANFDANLGVGSYSVSVALTRTETHLGGNYQWKDLALVFNVINGTNERFIGSNWIPPKFQIETGEKLVRSVE